MNNRIFFSERQRFHQVWVWIFLLGINGLFISGLVKQLIFRQQFGDKPMSDTGLIAITVITFLISALFLYLRLETVIKSDGVYVRFFPFQHRFTHYPWEKILESYVRKYSPLKEYGGWGVRGFGKDRALNVSGNQGIQLVTKDGSKILIGTNKAGEAANVLREMGH